MNSEAQATPVAKVASPFRYVTLQYLKDGDGKPVVVGCGPTSEVAMFRALGLPSVQDPAALKAAAASMTEEEAAASMLLLAPEMIEGGCFLLGPGGEQVRPAFSWKNPLPPSSLSGHYLRDEEKLALLQTIMEIHGYLGGAVADASFSPDGGGGEPGRGTVGDGAGPGADAQGGPAGS